MAGTKHKRSNTESRDRARRLARFWYQVVERDGGIQYARSGRRRIPAIPEELPPGRQRIGRGSDPAYWIGPSKLTARGTETRSPHQVGSRRAAASRVEIGATASGLELGRYHAEATYAREAMRHVAACCYEARLVLEMDAAGWGWEQIRDELGGCSEQIAREYLTEGLALLISFQRLRRPTWHAT